MMKYAINNPEDFSNPYVAIFMGYFYCMVTILLVIACVVKMCTETSILDILNSYISYGIIVFVPNFAYAALPVGHALKAPSGDIMIKKRRRFIKSRTVGMWCCRFNFKFWRLFYCSFWYYYLPIVSVLLPFLQKYFITD